ncbi:MAG: hypothetical protein ACFFEE_11990 [Candidatus Thorarchaeota archaeon]
MASRGEAAARRDRLEMSTTWFIAKEYLKRLEIDFEEHGRKTFSLYPYGPTETRVIEVFPGKNWITLTTRLMDLSDIPTRNKKGVFERFLKANATLVEVNFGIDKKECLMIRNAIPVTGISYDLFNCTYEAHLAGVKFFHEKLKPQLE